MTTVEKLAGGGIALAAALAVCLSIGEEPDGGRPNGAVTLAGDRPSSATADRGKIVAPPPPPTPEGAAGQASPAARNLGSFLGGQWTAGGYLIGPAPSPSAAAAGLRPGDVITTVDGRPFVGTERDVRVVNAKHEAGGAELTGSRSGSPLAVTIAF